MATYKVVVKDADGYDISNDLVEGLKAAKKQAKYFVTDDYARIVGTTHQALATSHAEVQDVRTGECLYDFFRLGGR